VTPTTLFPTLQETLELHDQLILRFGGSKGVRDLGLLESALVRPQTGYYDTLSMQAARWRVLPDRTDHTKESNNRSNSGLA